MKNLNTVDFLLFDLGNVIINIDYAFSIRELKKNLPEEKWELASELYATGFHKNFERGVLTAREFRDEVRAYFGTQWSDELIDYLWNSLLQHVPVDRVELIKELNKDFRTGILSNTNSIHIEAVNRILFEDTGVDNLEDLFDPVFLSHEMGMIKPNADIYKTVADKLGVEPKKILFFDDMEENLKGAEKVGLQTFHINNTKALIRFFQDVH